MNDLFTMMMLSKMMGQGGGAGAGAGGGTPYEAAPAAGPMSFGRIAMHPSMASMPILGASVDPRSVQAPRTFGGTEMHPDMMQMPILGATADPRTARPTTPHAGYTPEGGAPQGGGEAGGGMGDMGGAMKLQAGMQGMNMLLQALRGY